MAVSSYHHGDLANAVIAAGLRRVRQRGLDAVPLREVGDAAAVRQRAGFVRCGEALGRAAGDAFALRDAGPSPADMADMARMAHTSASPDAAQAAPLTRLLVRDQGKIFPLQVDAIECLRSDNKYTAISSKGRSYLVRLPIADFETRLDPTRFLRVQRGCIVNLDFVDSLTPDENSQLVVQLRDGTRITANREVSKMLREQSL
mgnify:CR=1 FL=1